MHRLIAPLTIAVTHLAMVVLTVVGRWAPWAEQLLLSSAQRPTRYVEPSRDARTEA